MNRNIISRTLSLITVALLLTAIAINKNGKVAGVQLNSVSTDTTASTTANISAEYHSVEGDTVILTSSAVEGSEKIIGYAGTTPVEIHIVNGSIVGVVALENDESPRFFNSLTEEGLFEQWNGLQPKDALAKPVDAVSGATYSSDAVINTVRHTLAKYVNDSERSPLSDIFSWKLVITLLVIISAAILPFLYKNKTARLIQLVLNVIVIGFWSHSFLSLSLIVNAISNGFTLTTGIIPVVLLIIAFIFPLFGKSNHYCNYVCPLGSLQEIAGSINKRKIKMSARLAKWLDHFRQALWVAILLLMMLGIGFDILDYEAFSAFMLNQASTQVLVLACVFVILSIFTPRPYCRFICPTGTTLKIAQQTK